MAGGVTLSGDKKVNRALRGYTPRVQAKAIPPALRKGVRVIVGPLRRATPKSKTKSKNAKNPSGTLRKSTGSVVRKYKKGAIQFAVAGHRWPKGAAAHLVSAGTDDRYTKGGQFRGDVHGSNFFDAGKAQLPAAGKVFVSELKVQLKSIAREFAAQGKS